METFLTVIIAIYLGIGLYEFYVSYLNGDTLKQAVVRSVKWPVDVYSQYKQLFDQYRNRKN